MRDGWRDSLPSDKDFSVWQSLNAEPYFYFWIYSAGRNTVFSVKQSGGPMKLFSVLNVDEKEKDDPTNAPESGDKKPDQK